MRGQTRRIRKTSGRGGPELHLDRPHAVGVSKNTDKAWRNGRTRATGSNGKASVDWYRSTMDKTKLIYNRYLSQDERTAIARLLNRDPGTISREISRNSNPTTGDYELYRAQ